MAHHKRRKRTFGSRIDGHGRKTFVVNGYRKARTYGFSHVNIRQALKRDIWAGWE